MHFCFLNMPIEYYSPVSGGAISTIMMQHAKHYAAAGHRVTILTCVNNDEVYQVGDVVQIQSPRRENLTLAQRALSKVRRKVDRWDYDYYEHYVGSFTRAICGLDSAPDVVICYNDLHAPKFLRRLLPNAKLLVNLQNEQRTNQADLSETITAVDKFVACSRYIKGWLAANHGIPDQKLAVINNGIDLDAFFPRDNYLQPSDPVRVLFIGRIDRNKGPDIAADAVGVLQKEGLPVKLVVAGGVWFYDNGRDWSDPFFCELQEKIKAVNGEYLGHVTRHNVPEVVRNQDIVCVLSRSQDPNPLVCLEGMASGCAVIGATRGGIPDAFGDAGTMVDPDDFNAVVVCMRKLVSDVEYLRSEKERAYARSQQASWAAAADKLMALIA
jgi:glycosyltransferase involved in cell wall biosynthesis